MANRWLKVGLAIMLAGCSSSAPNSSDAQNVTDGDTTEAAHRFVGSFRTDYNGDPGDDGIVPYLTIDFKADGTYTATVYHTGTTSAAVSGSNTPDLVSGSWSVSN